MMDEREILRQISGLQRDTLHVWIKRGWVAPRQGQRGYQFREIDLARIRLIREFSIDLELGDDTLDVALPLLDQIHGLRSQLRRLANAVEAEPEEVRKRIARKVADTQ